MDAWPVTSARLCHCLVQFHWIATSERLHLSVLNDERSAWASSLELLLIARLFAIGQRVARSLFKPHIAKRFQGVCEMLDPLHRKDGRTHLGSINSFNQASPEVRRITSLNADNRALVDASLALAGTKQSRMISIDVPVQTLVNPDWLAAME